MGDRLGKNAPRIFYVNWFRKTLEGKWLWPGYGENSRVLEWMCERVKGRAGANSTPIGLLPGKGDLNLDGMNLPPENVNELLRVDADAWKAEIADIEQHFAQFGNRLPARLRKQLDELKTRLG
jgi:phosphoenolpyruvate carboxykinase (GTP)